MRFKLRRNIMKSDRTKQTRRVIGRIVVLLAMGPVSSTAYAQATMADLVRVSQARGDDYKALRDDLLRRHPEKWDVAAATAVSWEAGITALALNARLAAPDDIKRWEAAPPRPMTASGKTRAFRVGDQKALRAWQIEQIWSAGRDFGQDLSFYGKSPLTNVPTALWRGIWDEAENELLRKIAIHAMASGSDPATYATLASVLGRRDYADVTRHICLLGLGYRRSPDVVDLILESWDEIALNAGHVEVAIGILGRQHSRAAREKLAAIAMDADAIPRERAQAIAIRGADPESEDSELFVRFLSADAPAKVKEDALRIAASWPVERIRPVVRFVFENETDRGLISEAMAALARCHLHADPMGTATDPETPEDIRLIDAAVERLGSPEGLQRSRDFCVRTIEGYRGPLVGDEWPWERDRP